MLCCFSQNYFTRIPNTCKVMGLIMLRNLGIGFYKGIKTYKKTSKPITNLFHHVVSNFLFGIFETIFWPVTLPLIVLEYSDDIIRYFVLDY